MNQNISKGDNLFNDNIPIFLNIAIEQKLKDCILHKHDFIEIAYVYSGRGIHRVGGKSYPVAKGSLSIINYDTSHVFIQNQEDQNGDFIVYNCIFKPEFIDYSLINSIDFKDITKLLMFNTFFVDEEPAINLKLIGTDQKEIEDIYTKMQLEYFNTQKGYLNILRSGLIELLTKIFRIADNSKASTTKHNQKYEIIQNAFDFLNSHYSSNDLNIDEVAMKSFLSRSYFSKIFKECTGRNYTHYLQNLRISHACKLLKETSNSVTEIMQDVGFKDIKHFNKLFKKITGRTPLEYRKI